MCELLDLVNMNSVWAKDSFNYGKTNQVKFSDRLSKKLVNQDLLAASQSVTLPHYAEIIKGDYGEKFYFGMQLPRDFITTIVQLRLNRNQVFIGNKWINVGEFKTVPCKFCGGANSLCHVLYECPNSRKHRDTLVIQCQRTKPVLPSDPESIVNELCSNPNPLPLYKLLYVFVSSCVKPHAL